MKLAFVLNYSTKELLVFSDRKPVSTRMWCGNIVINMVTQEERSSSKSFNFSPKEEEEMC